MSDKTVICEICGKIMKDRLNGSHLFRKHNITLSDYLKLFPHSDIGVYKVNAFSCKICGYVGSGYVSKVKKHLKTHQLTIDDYKIKYESKLCKCGCGEITDYSYITHAYNDYIEGHYSAWNKGLTKDTSDIIFTIFQNHVPWSKGLTKDTDDRILRHSEMLKKKYESGSIDISSRTSNYKKTMLEKYGKDNYFATDQFKEYLIRYNFEVYGTKSPMQNPEFFEKNKSFRIAYKLYMSPNGKKFLIQGYEDLALDILLKQYDDSEIISKKSELPKFEYNINGKTKRYYPDFLIKTCNKIIEVKSPYTYSIEKFLNEKKDCVLENKYDYEIWIFTDRKTKELTIYAYSNTKINED